MADSETKIKVVDRRMFTAEGELREEALSQLELENAAPEPPASAPPAAAPEEPAVATSQAFLRLLDMLAQTASLYLEGIPDPATGRRSVDLGAARQIVDSLLSLRDKTRGRLSFEENDALDGLLGELQLVFTRLSAGAKRPPPIAHAPVPRRRG